MVVRTQDLTTERIREAVRSALKKGIDSGELNAFLRSVDWSGPAMPALADTLGQLDLWTTEYAEGNLSPEQYVARLLAILEPDPTAAAPYSR